MAQLFSLGITYALMKYTFPLLALSVFLIGCGHRSDAEIRKSLPGAWHFVQASSGGNGDRSTFTVAPNGDFTSEVVRSDGTLVVQTAGTFQVKDGYLIGTVTNSSQSQSKKHLPFVLRAKIVQADAKKMVIVAEGTTNRMTIEKDAK